MFTGLSRIFPFSPLARLAEHGDARMELRRREDEHGGSRRDGRDADSSEGAVDSATVSVQALAVFLDNFLSSVTEKPLKSFYSATHPQEQPQDPQAPGSPAPAGPNARAIRAYQQTAENTGAAPQIPAAETDASPRIGETLGAADIRLCHTIRNQLRELERRNVGFVTIERGENFLLSILAATQAALDQTSFNREQARGDEPLAPDQTARQ